MELNDKARYVLEFAWSKEKINEICRL